MFAASDNTNGIPHEQFNAGTSHIRGGLTEREQAERMASRDFSSGPKSNPKNLGPRPNTSPPHTTIALGTKTGSRENTLSIVFHAISMMFEERHTARWIEKILLRFWKRAPSNTRSRIGSIVAHLSSILSGGERGRTTKRLRQYRDHEKASLLLAGFLHTVKPQVLRRIGLGCIADIVDYSQPVGLMQCLLHYVIELEKARDKVGCLVLLDLIQEGSFEFRDQLALYCLVLDLIDSAERHDQHSAEIVAAKNKASAMLTAHQTKTSKK